MFSLHILSQDQLKNLNILNQNAQLYLQFKVLVDKLFAEYSFDDKEVEDLINKSSIQNIEQGKLIPYYYERLDEHIKGSLGVEFWKDLNNYENLLKEVEGGKSMVQIELDEYCTLYTLKLKCLFDFYNLQLNFISPFVLNYPELSKLRRTLSEHFESRMLYYSGVNLSKLSHLYFQIEYWKYENYIKKEGMNKQNDSEIVDMEEYELVDFEYVDFLPDSYNNEIHLVYASAQMLIRLGWTHMLNYASNQIAHSQIDLKVYQCRGLFKRRFIAKALSWLKKVIIGWLKKIVEQESKADAWQPLESRQKRSHKSLIEGWEKELEAVLLRKFSLLRFGEIIDIIAEYSESQACLDDIKECIERTNLVLELARTLKRHFKEHFLLAGIQTSVILQTYIETIRVLKFIDPSTLILKVVSEPINECLRSRGDTLRQMIEIFTSEEEGGLQEQLGLEEHKRVAHSQTKPQAHWRVAEREATEGMMSSDEDEEAARKWEPTALNKEIGPIHPKTRRSDIISTLVNVFGSEEALIKEYRTILSEKLLTTGGSWQKETYNLELLKKRFGDSNLQQCDVMLRDLKDSEAIVPTLRNQIIEARGSKDAIFGPANFNPVLISREFWPIREDEKANFKLPEEFLETFHSFKEYYRKLKRKRINWLPNLGRVSLTLHFKSGPVEFKVTPFQAAIISLFNNKSSLTAGQIAEKLETVNLQVRRKINFWISKGVLKETIQRQSVSEAAGSTQDIKYSVNADYDKRSSGIETMSEDSEGKFDDWKESGEDIVEMLHKFLRQILVNSGIGKSNKDLCQLIRTSYINQKTIGYDLQELTNEALNDMVQKEEISLQNNQYCIKK